MLPAGFSSLVTIEVIVAGSSSSALFSPPGAKQPANSNGIESNVNIFDCIFWIVPSGGEHTLEHSSATLLHNLLSITVTQPHAAFVGLSSSGTNTHRGPNPSHYLRHSVGWAAYEMKKYAMRPEGNPTSTSKNQMGRKPDGRNKRSPTEDKRTRIETSRAAI